VSEGLIEAGCPRLSEQTSNVEPLERLSIFRLGGEIIVYLYLIQVSGDMEVCFKIGRAHKMDTLTVVVLSALTPDLLWSGLRAEWLLQ
jgi:hypothetical protein